MPTPSLADVDAVPMIQPTPGNGQIMGSALDPSTPAYQGLAQAPPPPSAPPPRPQDIQAVTAWQAQVAKQKALDSTAYVADSKALLDRADATKDRKDGDKKQAGKDDRKATDLAKQAQDLINASPRLDAAAPFVNPTSSPNPVDLGPVGGSQAAPGGVPPVPVPYTPPPAPVARPMQPPAPVARPMPPPPPAGPPVAPPPAPPVAAPPPTTIQIQPSQTLSNASSGVQVPHTGSTLMDLSNSALGRMVNQVDPGASIVGAAPFKVRPTLPVEDRPDPAYLDKSISAGATAPPPPHVRSAIPQGASIAPTGGAKPSAPAKPDVITQDYKDQGKLLEDLAENKALTNDISAQGLEGLGKLQGTQAAGTEQRAAADYADSKKIIDNYNTSSEQAAAFKRDPERFMHDSNLLKKGLMVLAVGLSSIGSGLRGGPNPVLDNINKMIDRDIENQQRQYEQLKARGQDVQNQYSMNLKALGNREAAVQASRGQTVDAFKNHINAQTIGTGSALLINQGKLASKELDTTNDLRLQARADAAAKAGAGGGLGNYDKMLMAAVKEEQTNIREGVSPPADMAEIIRRAKARVPINGQFPKVDVQGSYGPKTPKPGKEDAALTREATESELSHKKLKEVDKIIQAGGMTGVWGANRSAAEIGGNEAKMARLQGESARGTLSKATEATIEGELPHIPRTDFLGFDRERSKQAVAAARERANDLRARQGKPPLPPDDPSEEDLNSIGATE